MKTYDYPEPPRTTGNTIGDYYENKRLAAKHWHGYLMAAHCRCAPSDEIRWLQSRYDDACYVGD